AGGVESAGVPAALSSYLDSLAVRAGGAGAEGFYPGALTKLLRGEGESGEQVLDVGEDSEVFVAGDRVAAVAPALRAYLERGGAGALVSREWVPSPEVLPPAASTAGAPVAPAGSAASDVPKSIAGALAALGKLQALRKARAAEAEADSRSFADQKAGEEAMVKQQAGEEAVKRDSAERAAAQQKADGDPEGTDVLDAAAEQKKAADSAIKKQSDAEASAKSLSGALAALGKLQASRKARAAEAAAREAGLLTPAAQEKAAAERSAAQQKAADDAAIKKR
ncbi:hypothetical protein T484DRAFT_1797341, partial [Baffinella frigidus]